MITHPLGRGLGYFRRASSLACVLVVIIGALACQGEERQQGFGPQTSEVDTAKVESLPTGSAVVTAAAPTTLFTETFDDASVAARGWYDNTKPALSTSVKHAGSAALQWAYSKGATVPANSRAMRKKFTPTDRVYLRFWAFYSTNWVGSGRPYHPHEFQIVTTEDDDYVGPASTRLTAYVEHNYQNGGVPQLHLTDSRNIDVSRVRQDLTSITELRSIAGCNGNSDAYATDCFPLTSTEWLNEKAWKAATPALSRGAWHQVEGYFQLNTITGGKADRNGVVQYWLDGQLLIDHADVVFRTGARPNMRFNQLLLAPYIGDGSPLAQTTWIDDLLVATGRPTSPPPPPPTEPPPTQTPPPGPTPIAGLTLSPASATLAPGAKITFRPLGWLAGVDTAVATPVTWSATGGTITSSGVYTAGTVPGKYAVTAKSIVSPNHYEDAPVTITGTAAVITALSILPASVSLAPSGSQQFTASALLSNGTTQANPSVSWTANGGTITTGGRFTAPATAGTYRVIGTTTNGKADTSTVTVVASNPPPPPGDGGSGGGTGGQNVPELPSGYTLRQTWTGSPMVPSGWAVSTVSNYSLIEDRTALASPPSVVQVRYPASHRSGNGPGRLEWNAGNAANVLVTYWFKYDPNFNGEPSSVNKHIFVFGCNNVLAYSTLRFVGNVATGSIDAIPENGASGAAAFQWLAGNGGQRVTVSKTAWTRVTMEVTRTPDSRVRLWANGVKVADRPVTFNDNGCRYVKIDPTWGGNTGAVIGREGYLYFDEVRIYTK